jgi:hypothetical protein
MAKYDVYHGQFPCHTCKTEVSTLRFYIEDKLLTWMCENKHISSVNLNIKKTKKDYEREKRK